MQKQVCIVAFTLLVLWGTVPAGACELTQDADISTASVVVVGRIKQYEIVKSTTVRSSSSESRVIDMPYARFTIQVEQVLRGHVPRALTVTWAENRPVQGFLPPGAIQGGSYLIGLWKPVPQPRPVVLDLQHLDFTPVNPEPKRLTVVQALCTKSFFFDASSDEAMAIQRKLLSSAQ